MKRKIKKCKLLIIGYLCYFLGCACFCLALFLPALAESQFFFANKILSTDKLKVISCKQKKIQKPPRPRANDICNDIEVQNHEY